MIALELDTEEMRALGDGLSDIGRFSLPELFFEGTRRSRARGLFEQSIIHQAGLRMAREHLGVRANKHAQFRRAEKVDEGMALKI